GAPGKLIRSAVTGKPSPRPSKTHRSGLTVRFCRTSRQPRPGATAKCSAAARALGPRTTFGRLGRRSFGRRSLGRRRLAVGALGRGARDDAEPSPLPAAAAADEASLPPELPHQTAACRTGEPCRRSLREIDLALENLLALRGLELPGHGHARTRDLLDAPETHLDLRLPARAH